MEQRQSDRPKVAANHAGNLVKALAPFIGGHGGGKPEMGQAGGKNADKLDLVLGEELDRLIKERLET